MAPIEESKAADAAAEEDSPIIKELKEVDDRYLALHREYEKAVQALTTKYSDQQKPILEDRRKLLLGDGPQEGPPTGTPALRGFWLQALQNHPQMEGEIEEHDEPVMEYLQNISVSDLDPDDAQKGFRLQFHFSENPYFENAVLSKEFHSKEASPYRDDIDTTEIVATTIKWKPGKDVTVEKVKKEAKGKKSKASKAKEEPRPSFFRDFFKSMKQGDPLPDDIDPHEICMAYGGGDDLDEEKIVVMFMEHAFELGQVFKDQIIPFAVRFYTGEAAPDHGDDSDEDEDDDEDDEDDEDETESEDDGDKRPAKGKSGKANKKAAPKDADAPKEECKQQ
jgi:nucleosome assembly protein 1-like 1